MSRIEGQNFDTGSSFKRALSGVDGKAIHGFDCLNDSYYGGREELLLQYDCEEKRSKVKNITDALLGKVGKRFYNESIAKPPMGVDVSYQRSQLPYKLRVFGSREEIEVLFNLENGKVPVEISYKKGKNIWQFDDDWAKIFSFGSS